MPRTVPSPRRLLAALLVTSPLAQAGRPLISEDAGVIAAQQCELEGARSREQTASATTHQLSLQWACGLGLDSQLALRLGRAPDQQALELNGKTGLHRWGEPDRPAALAVAWAVLGTRTDGQALRHASTSVNLVLSTPVPGSATLHVNLGHQHNATLRQRRTFWSLALEHDGFGEGARLQPMAEIVGDDRDPHPTLNLALRYALVPGRITLDGSWGRLWGGEHTRLLTLGFKAQF